jgi:hypothetical protein
VDRLRPAVVDAEVTPAGRPAAFTTEGSPFARLELEQAEAAARRVEPPTGPSTPPIAGLKPLAATPLSEPVEERADAEELGVTRSADTDPLPAFRREPQRLVSSEAEPGEAEAPADEPGEVDRVMLAKEFSGLLQLNEDGDEDNS